MLGKDVDVQGIIDDFGRLIYAEIDYLAEAENARRFGELYVHARSSEHMRGTGEHMCAAAEAAAAAPPCDAGALLTFFCMRPRRYKDALEDIITVPYVYPNMTTSKVLVMDWMAGVRLTDTQALTALNLPKKKLIDSLVQVRVAEIQYP